MKHTIFTIITPVADEHRNKLALLLTDLEYRGIAPKGDPLRFGSLDMVHYASLFLYDDPVDGCSLVFENNIDGDISAYLTALVEIEQSASGGSIYLDIYNRCVGFETGTLSQIETYWRQHIQMPNAAYIGASKQSRNTILMEQRLHEIADISLGYGGNSKDERTAAVNIRKALETDPAARKFSRLPPKRGYLSRIEACFRFIVDFCKAILLAIAFVVLALLNVVKEKNAPEQNKRPDIGNVNALRENEDHLPTNHMVSVVHLHTDWSRLAAKKAAFGILDFVARRFFRKGRLGSIPTIHFAHWAIVNNGRRLIFVSNFDGSWDSYLDDFVLKAANGLTLAWSHGVGFPRSRFMWWGGAANGPEFIDWARCSMVPTLVWYSAYQGITVANINRNTRLRKAVADDRNSTNDGNWLEWI